MASTKVRSPEDAGGTRFGAPASPRATRSRRPSWLDPRLAVGVLLVLASVLIGARVVASSDHSVRVWALTANVAAGTTLTADDVVAQRVRLFDGANHYLEADSPPAGRTVSRDLGAGEFLPRAALDGTVSGREVLLPVDAGHMPDGLRRGQRIDVFTTKKSTSGAGADKPAVKVLSAVTVQEVHRPSGGIGGGGGTTGVMIRVPEAKVADVVTAARQDQVDLAVVVGSASPSDSPSPSPSTPEPSSSSSSAVTTPTPTPTPAGSADGAQGGPYGRPDQRSAGQSDPATEKSPPVSKGSSADTARSGAKSPRRSTGSPKPDSTSGDSSAAPKRSGR